jgi:hypothetical protein
MLRLASVVVGAGLAAAALGAASAQPARVGRPAPDIAGAPWINSPPLTIEALRGRVVLVEFWTYG